LPLSAPPAFNNLEWTQSGSGTGGTLTATGAGRNSANVSFSFLDPSLVSLSSLPALFSYTGTAGSGNPANQGFGFIAQDGLSGSFSFTYTGSSDLVVGTHTYHTGANLLSGTFGGANITGMSGATAGGVNDATTSGGTLTFTSDFLTFGSGARAYSFSMTSIADPLSAGAGQSLDSFGAVSGGSFQAEITGGGNQGVPEPGVWTMIILGFGAVGFTVRRRRSPAFAATA